MHLSVKSSNKRLCCWFKEEIFVLNSVRSATFIRFLNDERSFSAWFLAHLLNSSISIAEVVSNSTSSSSSSVSSSSLFLSCSSAFIVEIRSVISLYFSNILLLLSIKSSNFESNAFTSWVWISFISSWNGRNSTNKPRAKSSSLV